MVDMVSLVFNRGFVSTTGVESFLRPESYPKIFFRWWRTLFSSLCWGLLNICPLQKLYGQAGNLRKGLATPIP